MFTNFTVLIGRVLMLAMAPASFALLLTIHNAPAAETASDLSVEQSPDGAGWVMPTAQDVVAYDDFPGASVNSATPRRVELNAGEKNVVIACDDDGPGLGGGYGPSPSCDGPGGSAGYL